METIVFLERGTFSIEFPRPRLEHRWIEYDETRPEQVTERLHEASVAIVNKLPLRERELSQLPGLKLIAVAATGTDNLDLEFCRTRGIAVCNVRNYASHSLPEHVLMLMLALRRNLINYHADVQRGDWQKTNQFCLLNHRIHDLFGTTLGVIGYGLLGQAVANLMATVGVKVLIAERKGAQVIREGRASFTNVLQSSDAISLHCPLTDETRNLVGRTEFEQMKPNALLINTARGGLIVETDLIWALREKRIAGAAIDVLSNEPPREGNVLLEANLPNLIITPHVAWASQEAMQTLADQLIENIEAFVSGEVKNRVV